MNNPNQQNPGQQQGGQDKPGQQQGGGQQKPGQQQQEPGKGGRPARWSGRTATGQPRVKPLNDLRYFGPWLRLGVFVAIQESSSPRVFGG